MVIFRVPFEVMFFALTWQPSGSPTTHQPGLNLLLLYARTVQSGQVMLLPRQQERHQWFAELINSNLSVARLKQTLYDFITAVPTRCNQNFIPVWQFNNELVSFHLSPSCRWVSFSVYDLIFYSGHPDSQPFGFRFLRPELFIIPLFAVFPVCECLYGIRTEKTTSGWKVVEIKRKWKIDET